MDDRPETSRLLRTLVRLIGSADEQQTLISELDELYQYRVDLHGLEAANRWHRREVRRAARQLLGDLLGRLVPRPGEMMTGCLRNARHAARRLARTPAFSLTVVMTMALGIGANTAVFTVVDGILLAPLSFREPERLVGLWHTWPGQGLQAANMSPALYFAYREHNRVFEDVGMWDNNSVTVTGVGEPERVEVIFVTDGTLPLLGVQPRLGRTFTGEDDTRGTPNTALLSHAYWQQRFGADPDVIGETLVINGVVHEIVGVLPADLRFLNFNPALYLTFRFDRSSVYVGDFSYQGVARLRADATLEEANSDVARLIRVATDIFPGTDHDTLVQGGFAPLVRPLRVDVVGDVGDALWLLLGTVGLVQLVACANVANLLLVRAETRHAEMAIRSALGAGRWRLAAESLTETTLLATIGGLAGLGLAQAGVMLLQGLRPDGLPRIDEIGLDGRVVAFATIVSLLSATMAALLPLLSARQAGIAVALADEGRGSASRRRHLVRDSLVVSQIAMALILLVGSGLMIRSVRTLASVEPGFSDPEQIQTLRLAVPAAAVTDAEAVVRHHEKILRAIENVPGVEKVGLTSSVTMDGWDSNDSTEVEGFPILENEMAPSRRYKWVSPGYFETMRNPLLAGRDFTWTDVYERRTVAVITENLAREYWESPEQALGNRLRENEDSSWREIVGVVGDIRDDGIGRPARTTVFWPMLMSGFWDVGDFTRRSMVYALRSPRVGTPGLLDEIRDAIWSVNPNLPLANVWTMRELVDRSMARASFTLVMLTLAASAAMLLAAVGVYAVASFVVSLRTREIGVRMALGAEAREITRMVLSRALLLGLLGVAVGTAGAMGLSRLMAALLYGVGPSDMLTYVLAGLAVAALALLSSSLPARRAASIDPLDALKAQ